jgi:peptidoglycan/LPS O-acetylase OafA/YrhL
MEFANNIPLLVRSNGFLLPVFGLMILGLVNIHGSLSKLFSHKHLVTLGGASYAIYLLHMPLWLYFSRINPIDTLTVWALYMVIVLAAAISNKNSCLLRHPAT